MINQGFGKALGYTRRHNKALIRHLLKDYVQHGGQFENFGQDTILKMDETIDKHLGKYLTYQDESSMKRENRAVINYLSNSLSMSNSKQGLQQCQLFLKENKLYNDTSCYHWNQYRY